ncbi:7804_t:CDS:1, partial [Racocetra persica]
VSESEFFCPICQNGEQENFVSRTNQKTCLIEPTIANTFLESTFILYTMIFDSNYPPTVTNSNNLPTIIKSGNSPNSSNSATITNSSNSATFTIANSNALNTSIEFANASNPIGNSSNLTISMDFTDSSNPAIPIIFNPDNYTAFTNNSAIFANSNNSTIPTAYINSNNLTTSASIANFNNLSILPLLTLLLVKNKKQIFKKFLQN